MSSVRPAWRTPHLTGPVINLLCLVFELSSHAVPLAGPNSAVLPPPGLEPQVYAILLCPSDTVLNQQVLIPSLKGLWGKKMFLNSLFSRTRNKTTGNAFPLDSQEFSTFKKKTQLGKFIVVAP